MQKKSLEEIQGIINNIKFMDRTFRLLPKGDGWLLQLQYMEADVITGEMQKQSARKWYISPFMTETEIVETAFKACKTSMEHVVKEHFTYEGHRVYSPHFNVRARIEMCEQEHFDGRDLPSSIELIPDSNGKDYSVRLEGEEVGTLFREKTLSLDPKDARPWWRASIRDGLGCGFDSKEGAVKWIRFVLLNKR